MGNLLPDSGPSVRGLKASADLLKVQRAAVEEAIRIEEAALTEAIRLLAAATPWAEWPERLRRALRAALTYAGEGALKRTRRAGYIGICFATPIQGGRLCRLLPCRRWSAESPNACERICPDKRRWVVEAGCWEKRPVDSLRQQHRRQQRDGFRQFAGRAEGIASRAAQSGQQSMTPADEPDAQRG
jgi:hypothetical protein